MKTQVSLPELGLVGMTRGFLGAGIALVLADRLDRRQRTAVGWTLAAVGVLTTIPLVAELLSHRLRHGASGEDDHDEREPASAEYPHESAADIGDPTSHAESAPYPHG